LMGSVLTLGVSIYLYKLSTRVQLSTRYSKEFISRYFKINSRYILFFVSK
jgi:hypothetical protein